MKLPVILRSASALVFLTAPLLAQKPVFTEDFESGKIDPAKWDQRVMGTATVAVEPVEGGRGKYALHVHYPDMARGSYAFIVATHLPDSVRTHFFGRAYMRIAPGLGSTHNPLIFAGAKATEPKPGAEKVPSDSGWPISKFDEIGTSRGFWMPSYQENLSSAGQGRGEVTYRSETQPPLEKWFLLEWEFSDDPSTIAMWIDGEKLSQTLAGEKVDVVKFMWPKGSTTATGLVGGFSEFGFGARVWGAPMQGFDVYYDDIAIGTSRIGPGK